MSEQTRRAFLKNCVKIGGFAAIYSFGPGAVEDAIGWRILPAIVGGGGVSSWATWDGKDQQGWTGSQTNTNILLFDAAGAGDDDISVGGGLTGANLVATDFNNIAGAAVDGSGYTYRQVNALNQRMERPDAYWDLITGTSWSMIFKLANVHLADGGIDLYLVYATDRTAAAIYVLINGTGGVDVNAFQIVIPAVNVFTTDIITNTGNLWACFWRRDSGNVKFGFCRDTGSGAHGQPTKESDFDAGKIVDTGYAYSPAAGNWTVNTILGSAVNAVRSDAYYLVTTKNECLIAA